jgi:hypothetical protein
MPSLLFFSCISMRRRKKGQIRPFPQYCKGKNNHNNSGDQQQQQAAPASPIRAAVQAEPMDEDLAEGMSRLHMSASFSAVPRSVAFGHRRGGFMPGLVRGRSGASSRGGGTNTCGGGHGGEGSNEVNRRSRETVEKMNKE